MVDYYYIYILLAWCVFQKLCNFWIYPPGSKKIEEDRNWGFGNFYLSQRITLYPQNSIFFYLRTYPKWPGISIFSSPLVNPPTKVVSIFFSTFRDRLLVSFSIPHLSSHRRDRKTLTLIDVESNEIEKGKLRKDRRKSIFTKR